MIFAPRTVRYHSVISLKRVVRKTACANFAGEIGLCSTLAGIGCTAIEVPPLRLGEALASPLVWPDDSKLRLDIATAAILPAAASPCGFASAIATAPARQG